MPRPKDNSKQKQAYERLRSLLILQQLPAGERLREAEWSKRLNVHRSSLREALARLEAEGLVEAGLRTGYFVPRLAEIDLREVNEIRLALESLAIDRICQLKMNGRRQLRDMKEAATRFEQCIREGYLLGSAEADRRFHEALVDAAGSRRLSGLYRRAPLPLIHQEMANPVVWLMRERRTADQHHAMISALQAGSGGKAKRILHDHLLPRRTMAHSPQGTSAPTRRRKG